MNKRDTVQQPKLTRLNLWVMTVATGLVVANIYYNQPLLGNIASTFKVSAAKAGIIAMLTQLGYATGMLFIVPLGDMVKRKKLVMIDFLAIIIALVLTAISPNIHFLMIASFLVGTTSVIPQLLVPMAAHISKPEERGKTVGFIMSGLLVGILLSRTLSGYVGAHFGWRAMFLIAAAIMVILWIVLYFLLPEVYPEYKGNYKQLMTSLVVLAKEEPQLRVSAIRGALGYGCFGAFWTTLVFLLQQPQFNAGSDVAGAFGLIGAFGALAASMAGKMGDKGNANTVITFSIILLVISFVIFGLSSHSMVGLVIGVILMDMAVQSTQISNQTIIFSLRPEARNRINTVYMVTYFIGGALGTYLASQAWNYYKWNGVVGVGLLLSFIALIVHFVFIKKLGKVDR